MGELGGLRVRLLNIDMEKPWCPARKMIYWTNGRFLWLFKIYVTGGCHLWKCHFQPPKKVNVWAWQTSAFTNKHGGFTMFVIYVLFVVVWSKHQLFFVLQSLKTPWAFHEFAIDEWMSHENCSKYMKLFLQPTKMNCISSWSPVSASKNLEIGLGSWRKVVPHQLWVYKPHQY